MHLLKDPHGSADRLLRFANPCLSVVSQVELEAGVHRDPVSEFTLRRLQLDALLATLPLHVFTSETAVIYGRIVAEAKFSRRKVLDRMIAATALQIAAALVTANPADFGDIPGLKLEPW